MRLVPGEPHSLPMCEDRARRWPSITPGSGLSPDTKICQSFDFGILAPRMVKVNILKPCSPVVFSFLHGTRQWQEYWSGFAISFSRDVTKQDQTCVSTTSPALADTTLLPLSYMGSPMLLSGLSHTPKPVLSGKLSFLLSTTCQILNMWLRCKDF